jgi:hypothetical protein
MRMMNCWSSKNLKRMSYYYSMMRTGSSMRMSLKMMN